MWKGNLGREIEKIDKNGVKIAKMATIEKTEIEKIGKPRD